MRLISFLGTGNYQATEYFWPPSGESFTSAYVVLALTRLFAPEECVVLATEQAEAMHFAKLKAEFAQAGLPEPRLERIAQGSTEKELWDNFARLYELFQGQEEILLDITHGFRTQPLFAAAVVSYAQAIKPLSVRLVYGAFEARCGDRTPVWELTPFIELMRWAWAVEAFFKTGYAKDLAQLAMSLGDELARKWAKTRRGPPPRLKKFAKALEAFGDALATVRVGELLLARDKHPSCARWLAEALEQSRAEIEEHLPPLAKVLARLDEMLRPLQLSQDHLAGREGQRAMASLAKLYLNLRRYAEAGIALREGWVNLYASPEATCPGEKFDDAARREAEQRLTRAGWDERELMGLRNDIEHGGFRKRPLTAQEVCAKLARFIEAFERAQLAEGGRELGNGKWELGDSYKIPNTHQSLTPNPKFPATTWFVSRHPGAVEWARRHGIRVDRQVTHLDVSQVQAGDMVIGTLPVNLAAEVCARGARFFNLSLEVPEEARGRELSAEELERFGARIEEYRIAKLESWGKGVKI